MAVRAVVFDVGETLVDETRQWSVVAAAHGVPALTFMGVMGGVIERGLHHREAERLLAWGARPEPWPDVVRSDFYPDAFTCLAECRAAGLVVALAGNQPASAERLLREMDLGVDAVASSASWGVEKPSPEFFSRVASLVGFAPAEIAYVGDRVDNDVVPARAAGMVAVFVRRGPWGWLHWTGAWRSEAERAHLVVSSLEGLAGELLRLPG